MTLTAPRLDTPAASPGEALAARLDDPAVASALSTLLDHADLLAVLVEGLDQLVARSEAIGTTILEGFSELRSTVAGNETLAAVEVDLPRVARTATRLAGSDLVDPAAVDQVSMFARGLVQGNADYARQPVEVGGLLSLPKLLKDPDIARALSYLATVAKAVGREVAATSARDRAAAGSPSTRSN